MPLSMCESGVPAKSEQYSLHRARREVGLEHGVAARRERDAVHLPLRIDEREVVIVHAAVVDVRCARGPP